MKPPSYTLRLQRTWYERVGDAVLACVAGPLFVLVGILWGVAMIVRMFGDFAGFVWRLAWGIKEDDDHS